MHCTEISLKRTRKDKDALWLEALGKHINKLIIDRGYKSPYEFWIHALGDEVSRASLNYILNGQVDPKITTLKKLAESLDLDPQEILNFKIKNKSN